MATSASSRAAGASSRTWISASPPPPTLQCSKDTPELEFPTWQETEDEVKAARWAGSYPLIAHNAGRYLWSEGATFKMELPCRTATT